MIAVAYPKHVQATIEHVQQCGGPAITVTLCFEFLGMTGEGHPIFKDRLNNKLFTLTPYEGEVKGKGKEK